MRYWLDTEFVAQTLDLISIGVVAEDGREYYAQSVEADWPSADGWVQEHVIAKLADCTGDAKYVSNLWRQRQLHANGRCQDDCPWDRNAHIANVLRDFCDPERFGSPEFWTDCGAFDFVIVSHLFGDFSQWPSGWPYYFNDLQQWVMMLGNPGLPVQASGEHQALEDARHNRTRWEFLNNYTLNSGASVYLPERVWSPA